LENALDISDFSIDVKNTVPDLDFDPDALRVRHREERDKRHRGDGNDESVEVKGDNALAARKSVKPSTHREPQLLERGRPGSQPRSTPR
jgi:hypothetical protein